LTFAFLGLRASLFDFCWPFAMTALLRRGVRQRSHQHNRSCAPRLSVRWAGREVDQGKPEATARAASRLFAQTLACIPWRTLSCSPANAIPAVPSLSRRRHHGHEA